jgi:hypothetical protein
MLIGVPVAATPALGPHDEASVDPLLVVALAPDELDAVLLELLLPHPARNITPSAAATRNVGRRRGHLE